MPDKPELPEAVEYALMRGPERIAYTSSRDVAECWERVEGQSVVGCDYFTTGPGARRSPESVKGAQEYARSKREHERTEDV